MRELGVGWIKILDRIWMDGYVKMKEQGASITGLTVADDHIHLYAKDSGGVSRLFFKDDADVEHEVLGSGTATTTEDIQDTVGAMLTDSSTIDFTYNDGAGTETASVLTAALTKTDDTNVTLTLGGAPTQALVAGGATSLTLGWTGQLSVARGGTGAATFTDAGVLIGNGTGAVQVTTAGTSGHVLTSNGAGVDPTFQALPAGLTGSGTAGRVAFWDGASSLTSDADFTFSVDTLSIDNITLPATTSTEGIIRSGSNLLLHTFGTGNTFAGVSAGNLTLTGSTNAGFGTSALTALTSGVTNTGIGYQALKALTEGNSNMAIGGNALLNLTTGSNNTAIGEGAMQSITTVSSLTAIGHAALTGNTSGTKNTAIGESALTLNSSGGNNTAIGYQALKAITTASGGTAIGRDCLISATGASNSGVGNAALFSLSSGASNIALGEAAGFTLTTGGSCTFLGADADTSSNSISNSAAIGRNAIVASSNHMVLGDSAVTIGIAGAARPTGSGGIVFPDGTALSSLATNTAGLYANDVAGTVEMFAIDEGGAATQISPHNFTLFDPDPSYEYPWSYYSKHHYIGKEVGVDMWRLVKAVERLSGERILYVKDLPRDQVRDWDADQAVLVQRQEELIKAWDEAPEEIKAKRPRPEPVMAKPTPKWIADRLPRRIGRLDGNQPASVLRA